MRARPRNMQVLQFYFYFHLLLLLLFAGYTLEVVQDARDYADHAGRVDIGMEDVRLAVRKKQDALSVGPPTREVCIAVQL